MTTIILSCRLCSRVWLVIESVDLVCRGGEARVPQSKSGRPSCYLFGIRLSSFRCLGSFFGRSLAWSHTIMELDEFLPHHLTSPNGVETNFVVLAVATDYYDGVGFSPEGSDATVVLHTKLRETPLRREVHRKYAPQASKGGLGVLRTSIRPDGCAHGLHGENVHCAFVRGNDEPVDCGTERQRVNLCLVRATAKLLQLRSSGGVEYPHDGPLFRSSGQQRSVVVDRHGSDA
mmetsp:Transcript_31049/g.82573  ORF Transcript_31049/g.82573 Transcript_31049/m.82573 type:complete len:232 (-) Transcript_31049:731-1426(-)